MDKCLRSISFVTYEVYDNSHIVPYLYIWIPQGGLAVVIDVRSRNGWARFDRDKTVNFENWVLPRGVYCTGGSGCCVS